LDIYRVTIVVGINNLLAFYDAPPSSLMDSTRSLKVKTTKGGGVGVRSLVHNTLGIKGRVGTPGWD
jgi:hypothetical protein